ncbi:MAG: hypothetical protein Ct9H300mP12_04650 [Acidimicrobiales bacterium]|nr:MAG: hypothetical protein Ct9H300mP12_04650 [Acidimicrobiales bacterium]
MVRVAYVLFVERGDALSGDGAYYHEAANLLADGLGFTEPYRYLHGGAQEALFVTDPATVPQTANTALLSATLNRLRATHHFGSCCSVHSRPSGSPLSQPTSWLVP